MEKDSLLPAMNTSLNTEPSVFLLNIADRQELFKMYMPFLVNGGIFIKTETVFQLGEEVFVLIKLLDEPDKIKARGKVAWITPSYAQGGRQAGIGVQLSEDSKGLVKKIEAYLAGMLEGEESTETL